jgi:hypothetical protein
MKDLEKWKKHKEEAALNMKNMMEMEAMAGKEETGLNGDLEMPAEEENGPGKVEADLAIGQERGEEAQGDLAIGQERGEEAQADLAIGQQNGEEAQADLEIGQERGEEAQEDLEIGQENGEEEAEAGTKNGLQKVAEARKPVEAEEAVVKEINQWTLEATLMLKAGTTEVMEK